MNDGVRRPLRTCVGCRQQKEKKELIRIIREPDGVIALDPTGKKNGRGAYICRNSQCLEKAVRNHGLERSLKTSISPELKEQLLEEIGKIDE